MIPEENSGSLLSAPLIEGKSPAVVTVNSNNTSSEDSGDDVEREEPNESEQFVTLALGDKQHTLHTRNLSVATSNESEEEGDKNSASDDSFCTDSSSGDSILNGSSDEDLTE